MSIRRESVMIILFILVAKVVSYSQPAPPKWGKVSQKEIELKQTYLDSTASAVFLYDGENFTFSRAGIMITRHIRIKILNKDGFKYADVDIPYYFKDNLERILKVKAQTIHLNEGGKIIKYPVEKDNIFTKDVNENWKTISFTFPAVNVGSIIEYKYSTLSMNYTFIDSWFFQHNEPTLLSEISGKFISTLQYQILIFGEKNLNKYKQVRSNNHWVLNDLKPLPDEPFCYNKYDYAEMIRFQLANYNTYDTKYGINTENLMNNWPGLIKEIENYNKYKQFINHNEKIHDLLAGIDLNGKNELEKIELIYNYVTGTYRWNNKFHLFPEQSFNGFLESRSGNATELNLLLNQLLNESGIEAQTLVLSTREHGKITKVYPLLSQFNHMITYINKDEYEIFIDATDPARSYDIPDIMDLGQDALVLDRNQEKWIEVDPDQISQ